MNILHIIPTLSPRAGGPTTVVIGLVKSQMKRGDKVIICTTDKDEPPIWTIIPQLKKIANEEGIVIKHFPAHTPLLISPRLFMWLFANIRKFDIIHIHSIYRFPSSIAALLSRLFNKPYIIRPHGSLDPFLYRQSKYSLFIKRIYEKLIDSPNLKNATYVWFTSSVEKELTSYLKLQMNSIVIPNGIDFSRYEHLPAYGNFRKEIGVSNETKLILFLGRINFKKGLDLLIPAFAKFLSEFPNSCLAIVGPDNENYLSKVKRWIIENNIEKNVIIKDSIEHKLVKQAYVDSDLFVLPSYTENFGMTVIESLACGCPVLISDKVNIYKDLEICSLVRITSLDIEEIKNKMVDFFKNGTISIEEKEKARLFIKEKYTYDTVIHEVYDIYKKVIGVQ